MTLRTCRRFIVAGIGLALLAGCTPSYDALHGGQSLPLVNPSFMALPVQPWTCDPGNVGYCPEQK